MGVILGRAELAKENNKLIFDLEDWQLILRRGEIKYDKKHNQKRRKRFHGAILHTAGKQAALNISQEQHQTDLTYSF